RRLLHRGRCRSSRGRRGPAANRTATTCRHETRHRPHLPEHPALLLHDGARERHGRRTSPDARPGLGLPPSYALRNARGAPGSRAGHGPLTVCRAREERRPIRPEPSVRLSAPARDRASPRDGTEATHARRARRGLQPPGKGPADGTHPGDPRPRDHDLLDRTRYEGCHGDFRTHRGARLRGENCRGTAAESPHRSPCDRGLPWEVGLMTALLEVERIDVFYGRIQALRGVSLHVDEGEIVTLIGSNGAGKTTTVRAISGLTPAAAGSIRLRGQEISRLRERQGQLGGTLSGGEQQMLCIGRAMMSRPKVLLLDEPSLGLAPLMVDTIFQVIREINSEGTTILLIEQNALKALGVAARGYVLETGRIVKEGTSKALLESPDVQKAYLGI